MPSRKGPSQRDPIVRLSQAVRSAAPASMGGRVTNASKADVPAATSPRAAPATAGATLWVGPEAPTDGSVFWYDTDATC